jgi:hypothetical protein
MQRNGYPVAKEKGEDHLNYWLIQRQLYIKGQVLHAQASQLQELTEASAAADAREPAAQIQEVQ